MNRSRGSIFGKVACVVLSVAAPAEAQVSASHGAVVVQGNATNTTIRTGFTRADVRAAIDPLAQRNADQEKTIRGLERELGVNAAEMRSIARAFGKGDVPDDQIAATLIALAGEYRAAKAAIDRLPGDAEVKASATAALDNGDFDAARDLATAGALFRQVLAGVRYGLSQPPPGVRPAMNIREVRYLDDWPDRNLVWITIPQLTRLATPAPTGRVRFHRQAADRLRQAFAEIEARGLLGKVRMWCGSFAARSLPNGRTIGTHALGLAFDINCMGRTPMSVDDPDWVRVVKIFQQNGFAWAGGYKAYPDLMHFQASRLDGPGAAARGSDR